MKKHQQGFSIPSIVVIVAIILIGAVVYVYFQKNISENSSVVKDLEGVKKENWQEFVSSKYKYKIQFPIGWGIKEDFAEGGYFLIKPKEELKNNYTEPYGLSMSRSANGKCENIDWRDFRYGAGVLSGIEDKSICGGTKDGYSYILFLTSQSDDLETQKILEDIASTFQPI